MGEIENAEKVTIVWRQFYISITPTPKAQVDTGKRLLKKKTGEQETRPEIVYPSVRNYICITSPI